MRVPLAFLLGGLAMACTAWALSDNNRLIHVIDGDTVRLGTRGTPVRLVGLNAPETGERAECEAERALGERAKAGLAFLIEKYPVELLIVPCACRPGTEGTQACNYGRSCGVLKVDHLDVAEVMVKAGLAVPYECGETSCPKLPRPWCEQ